ncbi:Hypothetical predicted protein [Mytilus galloprovincialis]|uniref:Uncharacterized protein n=1 Tax=Mytilus galloprovincialis TaxID=29158 RepID=A0A8B6EQY1_MYTGA|nr:Hypothetical predicted protein [Mytilus galloprovincialis]
MSASYSRLVTEILFSANKRTSMSYVGIDDIHIYGKSEVTTSSAVTNTAFITNLTSPSSKDTRTSTRMLLTERSTKQITIPTTVQKTYASTDLKFIENKTSPTGNTIASSTLQATLTSPKNTELMTTSSKLETNRSTKKMPLSTTEHQTHISTDLEFTKNIHSSTKYPSSPSILQSTIISTPSSVSTNAVVPKSTTRTTIMMSNLKTSHTGQTTTLDTKTPSKNTNVQQTNFLTTPSHTEKNTPSTLYSTSSKHVTKKKTTTDAKKTTLNKHDSKTTDHSTTPYIIQVTKKTFTTKKNKATKSEAEKSDHISKGAQAGIGITVALLGVGLVVAVLFIMKKKISTIDQVIKLNKNEIQLESKYTRTETYINGDTKCVIENGVSQANNQTAWTSTEPLCKQ